MAVGSLVAIMLIGFTQVARGDEDTCAVIDGTGQCLVAATDPGRPGGPQNPAKSARPSVGVQTPAAVSESVPLDRAGSIAALQGAMDGLPPAPAAVGGPAAAAQAAVVVQRAVQQLTLRPPKINLSASGGFVGVPMWLWVDRGEQATGPVSTTAAAGAARVTATGRLVGVDWSMGPPGAVVHCVGPGTPWTGQAGASPDCGYTYSLRSLPNRTGGSGTWTVTATSVWQVDWTGVSGGAPVAGGQVVQVSSQRAVPVGEVQVLVSGGGQ